MTIPPGLTCAACRLPFAGCIARRTPNGFVHAASCASRTNLTGGVWVQRHGVMVWQPEDAA